TEGLIGYHVISRCSFKNHTAPPGVGGDYGIEALRIGYSYQRTFISRTIVEYCYFEKCNGDYEIISCKARENLMRYNTFNNNGPAHLTLRHGSRNMVYGNFFMDGAGVRIKEGQDHSVINNYFDTGEQMALQIQNHHFDPVDTVNISNNTFVSCSPLQLGGKGDYPPQNISFANNLFSSEVNPIFINPTNTETWEANIYNGEKELIADGFSLVSFKMNKNEYGLSEVKFPDKGSVDFIHKELSIFNIPVLDDDPLVMLDIMKQKRTGKFNTTPGCYLSSGKTPLKCYASADNTGPIYLH
ncbi:MAG: right-handed parallel beta-helix repeat-containing protein, partial [Cyclobacteriaceae bacterium]|nr:right-handed parallel beta-helix repeat-containing protein [Cyclobacteriaceae bacterium]